MSADPIASCPNCGSDAYAKQLSAAGFQLKGSGWYQTDFKHSQKNPETPPCGVAGGGCGGCA